MSDSAATLIVGAMTLVGVLYNGRKARATHKAVGTPNGQGDLTGQIAELRGWQRHHDLRDAAAFEQLGVEYPPEPTD